MQNGAGAVISEPPLAGAPLVEASESDEELMGRVQAGDIRAFEQLYDRHAMRAFRIARSVCPDAGRAEDAVQEGFLSVWRGRMSYRSTYSFRSWAMKIIRNRAIDASRREGSRPPVAEQREDEADPACASVDEQALARAEAEALRATLKRLPRPQSEVITLAYFGQMTHSEIAQRLSLPAGTVKGRMRLGLEKLREEMQGAGGLGREDVGSPARS
jgi:RNA polymerase sigma-70 factor, ECF subfamily